jgi:MOSC domain-containing protein YiiM
LRRNLITQGIDLNSLIGRRFRIGETVILHGRGLWPPCGHIVKLTGKREIFKYLAKQCGIGADVVVGGTIKVGDAIVLMESEG